MFEQNFQLWDVFQSEQVGQMIFCIVAVILGIGLASFLAVCMIKLKSKEEKIYGIEFAFMALVTLLLLAGVIGMVATVNSVKQDNYKTQVTAQIETKYNLKVKNYDGVKLNGYHDKLPLDKITDVSGIVAMERVITDNGNWLEPEFKFSLKQDREVILSPMQDSDTADLNPDTYLKK